jgi:hypothetical protein
VAVAVLAEIRGFEGQGRKREKLMGVVAWQRLADGGGMRSGSGGVGVVSFERGDRRGENGVKKSVAVAVLSEIICEFA